MIIQVEYDKLRDDEQILLAQALSNPILLKLINNCIEQTKKKYDNINETLPAEELAQEYRRIKIEVSVYLDLQKTLAGMAIRATPTRGSQR